RHLLAAKQRLTPIGKPYPIRPCLAARCRDHHPHRPTRADKPAIVPADLGARHYLCPNRQDVTDVQRPLAHLSLTLLPTPCPPRPPWTPSPPRPSPDNGSS